VKNVTPGRLLALGIVLFVLAVGLYVVPSDDYVFLPDPAHPAAPLVDVPGGRDPVKGGVYYVDIVVRRASILEKLFGGLHRGADLYPASAVNPPGVSDPQRLRIDRQDMRHSEQIAAAVALRAAGRHVVTRAVGAQVSAVEPGKPAVGKLQPDDVITAIDGKRVRSPQDVFLAMKRRKVGDTVSFTLTRAGKTMLVRVRTVAADQGPRRAIVGVLLQAALDIRLPLNVRINAGDVGGPSAGLPFALEVLEELGRDVVHGHKIAATGELFPDGSIGPIGGIKQKTIGARDAGVDAFLVPAGENARDARKEADGLRIIPVDTFPQALHALATLSEK